jgi:hypothetical protein
MAMYSLRKISKIRRLVSELETRAMGPATAAELLEISYSAARNYMGTLVEAGAATHHPDRRTHVRLHPDRAVVERFLDSLVADSEEQRVTLRRSFSRHCVNPGKSYLHVLADDTRFPLLLAQPTVRRDPLVAALFGDCSRRTT